MFLYNPLVKAGAQQAGDFPAINTIKYSQTDSAGTSHTVNLPSTLVSGNRLLIAFVYDSTLSPSVTFPAGWNSVTTGAAAAFVGIAVYERISDGAEGASITVTTGASAESASFAWNLFQTHSTTASEGTTANSTVGSTTPDPPSLNPSGWDVENTMWLTIVGTSQSENVTAYPSTFLEERFTSNSGGATGVGIGVAMLREAAASEDPGTFTIGVSRAWVTATIAVRQFVFVPPTVDGRLLLMGCGS